MEISIQQFNLRLDKAQERKSKLKGNRIHPIIGEKRIKRDEDSLNRLIFALQRSQRKKREKRRQKAYSELMDENFLNLLKEKDQEAQRVTNKMNAKKPPLKHNIINLSEVKDKERILKILLSQRKTT